MPSTIGSFFSGVAQGEAKNAARAKLAREQQVQDRNYAIALAGESRQLQGQAEDAYALLDAEVNSPNWNPAKTIEFLGRARRFDATYGPIWAGGSAEANFFKALNLGGSKKSGSVPAGIMGPGISIESDTRSPLAGFLHKAQKEQHAQGARDDRTEEVMGSIQKDAMQFAMEGAMGPGGVPDPDLILQGLGVHQAQFAAQYDLDAKELLPIYADLRAQVVEAYAAINLTQDQQDARGVQMRLATAAMTKYIDGRYTEFDVETGIPRLLSGTADIRMQMQEHADKMIMANYPVPQIKLELAMTFGVNGNWPNSRLPDRLVEQYASAPPEFPIATREFYENLPDGIVASDWMPVWDKGAKVGAMVNQEKGPQYGKLIPLMGAGIGQPTEAAPPVPGPQSSAAPESPINEREYRDKDGKLLTGDALTRAQGRDRAKAKLSSLSSDLGKAIAGGKEKPGSRHAYPGSIQPPGGTGEELLSDARRLRSGK